MRKDTVQVPHQRREIGLPRGQNPVVVVVQQTVGQCAGVEALERLGQQGEERAPVSLVQEDRLPPVAAGGAVIDGFGKLEV